MLGQRPRIVTICPFPKGGALLRFESPRKTTGLLARLFQPFNLRLILARWYVSVCNRPTLRSSRTLSKLPRPRFSPCISEFSSSSAAFAVIIAEVEIHI